MTYSSIIIAGSGGSAADTEAPSAPTGLGATSITQTTFTLSWTASTDNVGVTGYKIYKGGVLYVDTMSTSTSHGITGQTAGATNTWTVKAYDAAANESAASSGLNVTQGVVVYVINNLSSPQTTAGLACADTLNQTYWKTTSGATQSGDIFYTSSSGTTKYNGGNNYFSDGTQSWRISTVGGVSTFAFCF